MLARRPDSSRASCRLPTCGDREVSRRPQSCPTRHVRQSVRPAAAPKRAALAIPGRVRRVAPSRLRAVLGLAAVRRASFAARAPNRVRPSLSARRSADPPAPHATSYPVLCGLSLVSETMIPRLLPPFDGRRFSRSDNASRLWPGGADSRARGAKGSPVAFVFSLADAHSAEGNGLSRSIG